MVDTHTLKTEAYIPVYKFAFLQKLQNTFTNENDKKLFLQLCYGLESIFFIQNTNKINNIKQNYSYFERRNPLTAEQSNSISAEEFEQKQNTLLENIFRVLQESHFKSITLKDYELASKSAFLSDLPIQVDFAKIDSTMLTNFFEKYPSFNPYNNNKNEAPPFYKHFILFYRGMGKYETSGLFINHKINILTNDLYSHVKHFATSIFNLLTARQFVDKQSKSKNKKECNKYNYAQTDRVTLFDTYQHAKSKGLTNIFHWLSQKLELKEPTFSRLILVYRSLEETLMDETFRKAKDFSKKYSTHITKTLTNIENKIHGEKNEIINNQENEETCSNNFLQDTNENQNTEVINTDTQNKTVNNFMTDSAKRKVYNEPIRIEYFNEIPISDIEVCFPCKKLRLKTFDRLYLIIIILLGIFGLIRKQMTSNSSFIVFIITLGIVLLIVKGVTWYRSKEEAYNNALNQTLAESNISTDKEVLLSLVDNFNEQLLMETILAYFVVHTNHVVENNEKLNELCETTVREMFGNNINIKYKNIINILESLQLIDDSNRTDLRVKNLQQSIEAINKQWSVITQQMAVSVDR